MRVGWHDGGSRTQPRFTPRRRGGRDESVGVTVCLCACARAMGSSRGVVHRDVTANPKTTGR
jgi:hypothetical protein